MMNMIDKDILKQRINTAFWSEIENIIDSAPSIDIVRCKECKHWNEEDHWCNIRDSYGWDYKPDDFCSYGCNCSEKPNKSEIPTGSERSSE